MPTFTEGGFTVSAVVLFFFFQAEDGIRDYKVTGVQTCALPISYSNPQTRREWRGRRAAENTECATRSTGCPRTGPCPRSPGTNGRTSHPCWAEIGRASCRERV